MTEERPLCPVGIDPQLFDILTSPPPPHKTGKYIAWRGNIGTPPTRPLKRVGIDAALKRFDYKLEMATRSACMGIMASVGYRQEHVLAEDVAARKHGEQQWRRLSEKYPRATDAFISHIRWLALEKIPLRYAK